MDIMKSVQQYKTLEREIYLHLFLEAVRNTWNNGRLFTVSAYGMNDHGGEGFEGLEDLTSNSHNLLIHINDLLEINDLPESGMINTSVDSEKLEIFLNKTFGFDQVDPEDYKHLL